VDAGGPGFKAAISPLPKDKIVSREGAKNAKGAEHFNPSSAFPDTPWLQNGLRPRSRKQLWVFG
jgi:hypothetical protein